MDLKILTSGSTSEIHHFEQIKGVYRLLERDFNDQDLIETQYTYETIDCTENIFETNRPDGWNLEARYELATDWNHRSIKYIKSNRWVLIVSHRDK